MCVLLTVESRYYVIQGTEEILRTIDILSRTITHCFSRDIAGIGRKLSLLSIIMHSRITHYRELRSIETRYISIEIYRDSAVLGVIISDAVCGLGLRGPGACLGMEIVHHRLREQRRPGAPPGTAQSSRPFRISHRRSSARRRLRLPVS